MVTLQRSLKTAGLSWFSVAPNDSPVVFCFRFPLGIFQKWREWLPPSLGTLWSLTKCSRYFGLACFCKACSRRACVDVSEEGLWREQGLTAHVAVPSCSSMFTCTTPAPLQLHFCLWRQLKCKYIWVTLWSNFISVISHHVINHSEWINQ